MAAVTPSGVGTMSIYVAGQLMELAGKVDLEHGGIQREPALGPGGVITGRWIEKYMAPKLSIEIFDGSQVNVSAMKDVTAQPIQIAMRNGKTYLLTNGICTGEVKGDLAGGKFTLEYFGDTLQEVTA